MKAGPKRGRRGKKNAEHEEETAGLSMSMHSGGSQPPMSQSINIGGGSPLSQYSRDKLAKRQNEIRMEEEHLEKLKQDIQRAR